MGTGNMCIFNVAVLNRFRLTYADLRNMFAKEHHVMEIVYFQFGTPEQASTLTGRAVGLYNPRPRDWSKICGIAVVLLRDQS